MKTNARLFLASLALALPLFIGDGAYANGECSGPCPVGYDRVGCECLPPFVHNGEGHGYYE